MSGARLLVMPKLGLTMTEGTVSNWRAQAGERFAAGDVLVVVETDKVAYDVEAPSGGILDSILVEESQTVPVGTPIAQWRAGEDEVLDEPVACADPVPAKITDGTSISAPAPTAPPAGIRCVATPLARRLAREYGVDLGVVAGRGPRGRIQGADVKATIIARSGSSGPETAVGLVAGALTTPSAAERTMATRVTASKRDIPHFYLAADIELSATIAARNRLNSEPDRPRVSLTHLLVAAVVHALRTAPNMNRVWTEEGIIVCDRIDVGLAVDTARGLMNPVIRDLGDDSFYGVMRKVDNVVARARKGALRPDDFHGGALTISNAGMHDVRYITSIIVPDQSAILGIGAVQERFRPDAAGAPSLRREIGVVLSADHRIHAGVGALAFLKQFRNALADPVVLLAGHDWRSQ